MELIEGYENRYCIARNGDIYSVKKGGLLSKAYLDKSVGYYKVALSNNGLKKIHLLHRLLAKAFIPNPNGYPVVDHINRNRLDNRIENLQWTSMAGNLNNKSKYKNNKTGYANITKEGKYYRVKISYFGEKYTALRRDLEEAICQRNLILAMIGKEPMD